MAHPSRAQVIRLYKTLLHLGREYPKGYDYFRSRVKSAFLKNSQVTDPEQTAQLLSKADYVIKELEALYMLRKYRTLKKRYYDKTWSISFVICVVFKLCDFVSG